MRKSQLSYCTQNEFNFLLNLFAIYISNLEILRNLIEASYFVSIFF